jgi:hypothetical protein
MAFTPKILGQGVPAGSNVDLYTVPSATSTVVSTIAVANTTASSATATIYVRKAAASAATSNALIYAAPVTANNTTFFTLGITLAATDVVTVASGTSGALTFHAFGSELA